MPLVLISVILELHLTSRKKTIFLIQENETHRVPNFQLTILRMEKLFCINQYLLKVSELMNKDLAQKKAFNYFNIGDAKTLVKFKKM